MERAAALLRHTDRSIADVCSWWAAKSVGSFTTSFRRTFGRSPTEYRAAYPPASARARVPTCVLLAGRGPFEQFSRRQRDAAGLTSPPTVHTTTWRNDDVGTSSPHRTFWVHDQDEALAFYTEKLGMELRDDVTMPEMGNFRWLTVGHPDQPESRSP